MKLKKILVFGTLMITLSLVGCSSEAKENRIQAAKDAGAAAAAAEWSAETVEVDRSVDRGLGGAVGKDINEYKDAAVIADQNIKESESAAEEAQADNTIITFVVDRRTGLFHKIECEEVAKITTANRQNFYGSSEEAKAGTWQPCTICKPQ